MKYFVTLVASMILGSFSIQAEEIQVQFDLEPREDQVVYADVKPIIARHCVPCHSGPKPRAKLVLKSFPFTKDGNAANQKGIVARMIKRINATEKPMPPLQSNFDQLDDDQSLLVQQWLADGLLVEPENRFVLNISRFSEEGELINESQQTFDENPFSSALSITLDH